MQGDPLPASFADNRAPECSIARGHIRGSNVRRISMCIVLIFVSKHALATVFISVIFAYLSSILQFGVKFCIGGRSERNKGERCGQTCSRKVRENREGAEIGRMVGESRGKQIGDFKVKNKGGSQQCDD